MMFDLESSVDTYLQGTTAELKTDPIGTLDEQINELRALVKNLRAEVYRALDRLPWYVPDLVIAKVHEKTNTLTAMADVALATYAAGVDRVGQPLTLRQAADEWSLRVKDQLSPLSGLLSMSQITFDVLFEGLAADALNQVRWDQGDALGQLAAFPDPISTGLNNLASAMETSAAAYWAAGLSAALAIAGGIAGAVTAKTGVGLLLGLIGVGAGIAGLAGSLAVIWAALGNAVQEVEASWELTYAEWKIFGGKEWPKPTIPQPLEPVPEYLYDIPVGDPDDEIEVVPAQTAGAPPTA